MFYFFLRNELFDDVCEKMEETRREALREMDEAKEKEKKGGKVTAWNDKERSKSSDYPLSVEKVKASLKQNV